MLKREKILNSFKCQSICFDNVSNLEFFNQKQLNNIQLKELNNFLFKELAFRMNDTIRLILSRNLQYLKSVTLLINIIVCYPNLIVY